MKRNTFHLFARFSFASIMFACGAAYLTSPLNAYSADTETQEASPIVHIPLPVAPKGKPFPILANVRESAGKVTSMTVKTKGTDISSASFNMISMGTQNHYETVLPADTMTAAGLLYCIELVSEAGTYSTPWYPIKTASVEDKVQQAVESKSQPASKIARAKTWAAEHPYIATGAGVGAIAVGAAAASGGGGGAGGSSDISDGTGDTGTATGIQDTSAISGSISGSWSGTAMEFPASGSFSIIISDHGTISGSYSGTESGSISGSITSAGALTASGSAGNAVWSGQVNGQTGSLTASGTWSGYDGGGTWSGSGG